MCTHETKPTVKLKVNLDDLPCGHRQDRIPVQMTAGLDGLLLDLVPGDHLRIVIVINAGSTISE